MAVPPQLNFVTLACRDVERTADFLRAFAYERAQIDARSPRP
jgi:hypothetical protein